MVGQILAHVYDAFTHWISWRICVLISKNLEKFSAFAKAELSAGSELPTSGTVFISVNDNDKMKSLAIARDFEDLGFNVIATKGTSELLKSNGVYSKSIFKVGEGRPSVVDAIKNNEIDIIINTFPRFYEKFLCFILRSNGVAFLIEKND